MDQKDERDETPQIQPLEDQSWLGKWFEQMAIMDTQGGEDTFNRCLFFPYSCY